MMSEPIRYMSGELTPPNNPNSAWHTWWDQGLTPAQWLAHAKQFWTVPGPVWYQFPNGAEYIYAIQWPDGTIWDCTSGLYHPERGVPQGKVKQILDLTIPDTPKDYSVSVPQGQPRHHSLMEISLNIASGFIVSWFIWVFLVAPWYGFEMNHLQNLEIVGIFTVSAVIRGYFWRRLFNRYWEKNHVLHDN